MDRVFLGLEVMAPLPVSRQARLRLSFHQGLETQGYFWLPEKTGSSVPASLRSPSKDPQLLYHRHPQSQHPAGDSST